jgi:hypothetical protein
MVGSAAFMAAPPRRLGLHLQRQAVRHPVEPATHRLLPPQRGGLAAEDQKGRLEGILGVLQMAKDMTADTQDHWPVPLHKGRECTVVVICYKLSQQHFISNVCAVAHPDNPPDLTEDGAQL